MTAARAEAAAGGWLEAGAFVTAIGVLSLVYAVGHTLEAHPVAFILYATLGAAVAMLGFTGLGPQARVIARLLAATAVLVIAVLVIFRAGHHRASVPSSS